LRRSESRLRLALAGAWEWEAGTDDIVWSPEMFAITGLSSGTAHGLETYLKMIKEEDRDKAVYDLKGALGKGGPFTREFRIRQTDGAVIWLSISGVVEHSPSAKLTRSRFTS
jgi:PAS domain S-box-containing protein